MATQMPQAPHAPHQPQALRAAGQAREARPVTGLGMILAIAFALLMLLMPFQFQSHLLRHIYPHLRLFGLAYALSATAMAVDLAGVGASRWVGLAGRLLLMVTLATQGYLIAYLTGYVAGEFFYMVLLITLTATLLFPQREEQIFRALYALFSFGMGLMLAFQPGLFPPTFSPLATWMGLTFMIIGLVTGVSPFLPAPGRLPAWGSLLPASLPIGWYFWNWLKAGNLVGIAIFGAMTALVVIQSLYLRRAWRLTLSGLRRRTFLMLILISAVPLVGMSTFAVYAAQSLDHSQTADLLRFSARDVEREVERLLGSDPGVAGDVAALNDAVGTLLPPDIGTVTVRPLPAGSGDLTGGITVGESFTPRGQRQMEASVRRPDLGLVITIVQPLAYDDASRLALVALLLTIAIGVMAVVMSLVVSTRLTRHLTEVRDVAKAISTRHFHARVTDPDGDDEVTDLMTAVNEMAAALESYSSELHRLLAVTDTALSHVSFDELVGGLVERIRTELAADTAAILLLSEDGEYLTPVGVRGLEGEQSHDIRIPMGQGIAGRIAQEREPVMVADVRQSNWFSPYLADRVRSLIGAPLLVEGRVIGVVHVGTSAPHQFCDSDMRLLQRVADRIALAIDHAQLNATLEQRVQERTAELVAANNELEAFNYSVSHDLRGPLRNIGGFAGLLAEDYGDRLDSVGLDYLARIQAGIRRMGELIDALLQLSRVTRAPLSPEPCDLTTLAASVLDDLRRQEPARVVILAVQEGMEVHGDPRLLRIAMENLLHNAWKFSGTTDGARIEVGRANQDGETFYYIRDNGVGFDMAYAGKLFGAFERLHSDAEFDGVGIGLATVKRIVQRHGGRIWAKSAPGEGAEFCFNLEHQRR